MGIGNILLIVFLSLIALYCIGEILNYVSKVRHRNKWLKIEKEEKIERDKAAICGPKIIDRPEFSENIKKVLRKAVNAKVKSLRSSLYYEANEVNIWTTSIYTFQLQCFLEKIYSKSITSEEDCKEFVRNIIKTCHLEAIRLYPEQKEY